jgi:O-methyltransferase
MLKHIIRKTTRQLGYEIRTHLNHPEGHEAIYSTATYAPWCSDTLFLSTYQKIKPYTLVDQYRCFELWSLVSQSAKLQGSLIEVGVWRGGTGALIAERARLCGIHSPVYLCDTFRGVVKAGSKDSTYVGGEHADTSREIVEGLLTRMDLANVTICEGIFPDETGQLIRDEAFRFCHIDVDVYQSAADLVDWIWGKLVVGGIIVYDDYGFPGCSGIRAHLEEQLKKPDRVILYNLNGHAVVVKTQ